MIGKRELRHTHSDQERHVGHEKSSCCLGHQHLFACGGNVALTLAISGFIAAYNFGNGLDVCPRETSLVA